MKEVQRTQKYRVLAWNSKLAQSDRSNSIWPNDIIIIWLSWLVFSCISSQWAHCSIFKYQGYIQPRKKRCKTFKICSMLQSLPLPSRIKESIPIEWRDLWKLWILIIVIQHLPRISGWKAKRFRWRIIHFLPPRLCNDLYDLIIFIVSIRRIIIADHCCCAMIL